MSKLSTQQRVALLLATWFGAGFAPKAPGTVGSVAAVPAFLALRLLPAAGYWLAVVLVAVLGIWSAGVTAESHGSEDPQHVVIDEVAGVLIALGCVSQLGFAAWALAFGLFRILDIFKPGPISVAERLSPIGLGVMADDLLAGLLAGGLAFGIFSLL